MNIILVSVYLVSVTSGLISISPFTAIMAVISKWVTIFFANFVFTVLDEVRVIIGDNAFIGPNVSLYTPCHPTTPKERNTGVQWAKPIKIGNSVWIGGQRYYPARRYHWRQLYYWGWLGGNQGYTS